MYVWLRNWRQNIYSSPSSNKEAGKSRMKRDREDAHKLAEQFARFSIFNDDREDLACLMTRDIHVAPDKNEDALLDAKIHGESSLSTHVFVPYR